MQHGMHNALDLMKVERTLRDSELRFHYLVADPRVRGGRHSLRGSLSESLRSLFSTRPVMREECGV